MSQFRSYESLVYAQVRNQVGTVLTFLENGALLSITHGGVQINQVLGNPLEGALGNIYVRIFRNRKIEAFPLFGPDAETEFFTGDNRVLWRGILSGLEVECTLQIDRTSAVWFWGVRIRNVSNSLKNFDLTFSQDLGLAHPGMVRTNEAYTSQYIDHTILRDRGCGYLICSRQNQAQTEKFPWIMHGNLKGASGYLTDGFQFFGLKYKGDFQPETLGKEKLPSRNYQYEFAFPTLQTAKSRVASGKSLETVFFAAYKPDHALATTAKDMREVKNVFRVFQRTSLSFSKAGLRQAKKTPCLFNHAVPVAVRDLKPPEIGRLFGKELRHIEKKSGKMLSFFYGPSRYVSLRAKELLLERPQGQVLRSGGSILPSDETLSSTSYAYGLFHAQITIGNTSFNKLLSIPRTPLNVLKSSGLRIFVKREQGYQLLGVPSAYEVGLQHAAWFYRTSFGLITVRAWTSLDGPACFLSVASDGRPLEFLLSHNLTLGNNELDSSGTLTIDSDRKQAVFLPASSELISQKYPETQFHWVTPNPDAVEALGGDELLFEDGVARNHAYFAVKVRPVAFFCCALTGSILSRGKAESLAREYSQAIPGWDQTIALAQEFWDGLGRGGRLGLHRKNPGVERLNDLLPWYLHNAMVHFTIPHGLEQYSGAAWGLRDVCQGPIEFLMATRHWETMREVIKIVFSHQFEISGDWPQWFMFDRFQEIQSRESHADIIHWPMKAVCDYIESTNDFSILDENVVYTHDETLLFTKKAEPIRLHLEKEILKIKRSCIPNTALVRYGHGDWEDTLQPANPKMREQLVSAWTVELAYQTLTRYQTVCRRNGMIREAEELHSFCKRIQEDFNRFLVKDGVVAGLAVFKGKNVEYLLHPRDHKTGACYRLLPMTRGIISEVFSPAQAKAHWKKISSKLSFPDGVRLMDKPLKYRGGVENYFKRAETAANFGREIGLQYVHSHIRYVEAMAKLGCAEEVYEGLLRITPIAIRESVPNALPRQSNAYFSSSDGDFSDRYEAGRNFAELKTGRAGVKGGWRIYSSGPGIFFNQVISNFLGIREWYGNILLDPVIPKALNGLEYETAMDGKRVLFRFRVLKNTFSPTQVLINGREMKFSGYSENRYRRGGWLIPKPEFLSALRDNKNVVEIHL